MTESEADAIARSVALLDLLAYADTVHQTILTWLATLNDDDLDAQPDVPAAYRSDIRPISPTQCAMRFPGCTSSRRCGAASVQG